MPSPPFVVMIDFDGTITQNSMNGSSWAEKPDLSKIGKIRPGAAAAIRKLKSRGAHVVVWSGRFHPYWGNPAAQKALVHAWLNEHRIPFDELTHEKHPLTWAILDDRAIRFKDWRAAEHHLASEEKRFQSACNGSSGSSRRRAG
jgi:phosphoserine phosphatase